MKVIDLLNKIANGEKTKSINYKGESSLTYYLYDKCGSECDDTNLVNILNDEVEVIEEDKKIEKVNTYVLCDFDFKNKDDDNNLIATNILDKALEEYSHKINEIIDYINKEK